MPNSIKKHIHEQLFSNPMHHQHMKNDLYYDNPKARKLLEKNNPGIWNTLSWLATGNKTYIEDKNESKNG